MKMLPHVFTQSEMSDLAIDLASATQRKEAIEDRKKEANSQFKAEIDAQDAEIKRISRLISRGEELRSRNSFPHSGRKQKNCPSPGYDGRN